MDIRGSGESKAGIALYGFGGHVWVWNYCFDGVLANALLSYTTSS
jgi:hypothetical protein